MSSHGHCGTVNGVRFRTVTYRAWGSMKTRCTDYNPLGVNFAKYAKRGIFYDLHWEKFENFLADMGVCPEGLTLERVDNDKGYTKSNCKWATYSEQNKNRRPMPCPIGAIIPKGEI